MSGHLNWNLQFGKYIDKIYIKQHKMYQIS